MKKHGTMPPLDFFKKVHELPKEGDADYQKKYFFKFYEIFFLTFLKYA